MRKLLAWAFLAIALAGGVIAAENWGFAHAATAVSADGPTIGPCCKV